MTLQPILNSMRAWGQWNYLWWVPTVVIYYVGYSWFARQNNVFGGNWFWYMLIFGLLCPFWLIVSAISNNLIFDGMLYDNIMFLTYVFTMAILGCGAKFVPHQWLGVSLIVLGSIMLRVTNWK